MVDLKECLRSIGKALEQYSILPKYSFIIENDLNFLKSITRGEETRTQSETYKQLQKEIEGMKKGIDSLINALQEVERACGILVEEAVDLARHVKNRGIRWLEESVSKGKFDEAREILDEEVNLGLESVLDELVNTLQGRE